MKALLCKAFGEPETLVIEEAPTPKPGPGQVLVGLNAAGVNFPDGLMVRGKYQAKPPFPFSPGFEGSGVILEDGEGATGLPPGTRVAVHPFYGCFAEEVVVDARRVFPIPDRMDDITAAGFLIPYGTSFHALRDRAHLQPGETLLVLGAAGGIGLTAVELGKAMGARVIAACSTDEKLALCREYGAEGLVNYVSEDLRARVRELTGGRGVDVVYDPVGGTYTEPMVRSLARYGRYLMMGFTAGEIPKIPANLVLLKRTSIVGAFWGPSIDDDTDLIHAGMDELFHWYVQGRLRPHISRVYPFEQAVDAIEYVQARRALGKVVIRIRPDATGPATQSA